MVNIARIWLPKSVRGGRIHNDIKIAGRALTAEYLSLHPNLEKNTVERGHRQGYEGRHLHWPINKLTKGDVYVADNEGREGSLMGDKLGNIIYNKSGNGVVLDGYARLAGDRWFQCTGP